MLKRALQFFFQRDLFESARSRAESRMRASGRAWPCRVIAINGAIVTVAFEIQSPFALPTLTIPKAESPWIRMPTQLGDFGWTVPADAYLGAISGLGNGVATMARTFNLSELVFVPISNAHSPPSNPNAAIIQGPDGAIIQTTQGTTSNVTVNQSGVNLAFGSSTIVVTASAITLTVGGYQVEITSSGLSINGIPFMTHTHSGVTTGSGDTGGVV